MRMVEVVRGIESNDRGQKRPDAERTRREGSNGRNVASRRTSVVDALRELQCDKGLNGISNRRSGKLQKIEVSGQLILSVIGARW